MDNIIIYNKKEINDTLSCSICLEYYNRPRNLLCGHSFCTQCLEIIKISDNVIICPLCRFKTQLFNLSINDLPINSNLVSVIDLRDYNDKIKKDKPKLKKSKSADCLCINKNDTKKNINNIYFTKSIMDNYDSDDYIEDHNCCYQ
tara:strand:+ start:854 stop:1288 length:435 start_codon:yes stop_codon:yes gene_type:complete